MAELITLQERNNEVMRNKLGDLFVSMERNLSVQTNTLSNMYKLQVTDSAYVRERDRDAAREKLLAINERAQEESEPAPQVPEVKGKKDENIFSAALVEGLKGLLGSLSLRGLIRLPIAALIGSFLQGAVETALTDMGVSPEFAKAIGDGVWWASLGSAFGWRMAAVLGFGATGWSLGKWFSEGAIAQGLEQYLGIDAAVWPYVGATVGGLLALVLPGLIGRALRGGLARLRVPPINPNTTPGSPPTTPSATTSRSPSPLRNFEARPTGPNGATQYYSTRTGARLTGGAHELAARTAAMDAQAAASVLEKAAGAFSGFRNLLKVNALIGGLISLPYIASILMSDLPNDEKAMLVSHEVGWLGGSVLGATVGALGASAIPGVNLGWGQVIGGLGGGLIGGFFGGELADYIAGLIIGNPTSLSSETISGLENLAMQDPIAGRLMTANNGSASLIPETVEPRPSFSAEEQEMYNNMPYGNLAGYSLQVPQSQWDEQYGALYNPDGTLRSEYQTRYNQLRESIAVPTAEPLNAIVTAPIEPAPLDAESIGMSAQELSAADAFLQTMQESLRQSLGPQPVVIQGGALTSAPNVDARSSTTVFNQVFNQSGALENSVVLPFR